MNNSHWLTQQEENLKSEMHELYPEKVCQVFLVLGFLRLNAGAKNFDYPTSNLSGLFG